MPQVDFITYFETIFFFSLILFIAFCLFNMKILPLLNYQKKTIIYIEFLKNNLVLSKKYLNHFNFLEQKQNIKK